LKVLILGFLLTVLLLQEVSGGSLAAREPAEETDGTREQRVLSQWGRAPR
jgi:hypothetical protein